MRISHELRTPLTAIQGHVQAIADGVIEGEDEQQASLEIVLAEAGRLQRLIGDLLDLARLESRRFSLNVEEVDLLDVCERAAGAQREEARARQIKLQVRRGGDARRASATATASCRSSPTSSRTPSTRRPPTARSRSTSALGEGVGEVVVSDTGPGIPEAERATILRPFVTSDARHGIGLGLPVASELAHAMGGTLAVGERPGGGAAFTLSPAAGDGSGKTAEPLRERRGACASRRPSSWPSRRGPPRRAHDARASTPASVTAPTARPSRAWRCRPARPLPAGR